MNHRNKGFTLIELLVVVAIISLLTSVVLASVNRAKTKAQDTKIVSELKQIQSAMELYYNDNGRYPLPTTSSPSTRTYCIGPTTASCLIGGTAAPDGLLSSATSPSFSYKPSSSFLVGGLYKGFLYQVPPTGSTAQPIVIFATNGNGLLQQTAGVWITGTSN